MGLTAIILTNKNPSAIKLISNTVSFANEIIYLVDGVEKNIESGKTKIYFRKLDHDFASQRNYALSKASHDWVLFIDDDEVVSKKLALEIQNAITSSENSGYYLKRVDRYHHQILNHGETGDIKIIRLGRKSAGAFVRPVHEVWKINGEVGKLKENLIHERGELVSPFISRMAFYGPIDAQQLTIEGKPFAIWRLALYPKAKFILNYFIKFGFLDGLAGLFHAYLMSIQSLSVRVFQWQKT